MFNDVSFIYQLKQEHVTFLEKDTQMLRLVWVGGLWRTLTQNAGN